MICLFTLDKFGAMQDQVPIILKSSQMFSKLGLDYFLLHLVACFFCAHISSHLICNFPCFKSRAIEFSGGKTETLWAL